MRPDVDIPADPPPSDKPEPWKGKHVFKVGDRVVVTAGIAECQIQRDGVVGDDPERGRCPCMPMTGHHSVEQGRTGTIHDPAKDKAFLMRARQGHNIGVVWDSLLYITRHTHAGAIFAAAELAPLGEGADTGG